MPQDYTPTLYLIGGPNGAGKTTFAKEYLPNELKCLRFLNSDEIAKGLSPFDSAAGQVQAARILLSNLKGYLEQRKTFALESTLSGLTYVKYLDRAKSFGYRICVHYLWLPSADESFQRVQQRVVEGGHDVPEEHVYRRYPRVIKNALNSYLPLADSWFMWDASKIPLDLLAASTSVSIGQLKERYE